MRNNAQELSCVWALYLISETPEASDKWISGTVNGNSVQFGYDGHGRRSSRTVGTGRNDYWYDVTGLSLQTGVNPATYLRDPDGTVLSVDTDQLYNYGRDRLGSVTAMVTTGQSVANSYSYDPWGETIGLTGTAYNPFLFTGVYKDGATGLYAMTQRYYQSASGRFTQLDPLPSQLVSVNRYAYADCNPANFTDPAGLAPSPERSCIKGALIAGITGFTGGAATGAAAAILTGPGFPFTAPVAAAIGASLFGFAGLIGGCGVGLINYYGRALSTCSSSFRIECV